MKSALDSWVIVSELCDGAPDHDACRKVPRIFTLNLIDFRSFHRPGDPEILPP